MGTAHRYLCWYTVNSCVCTYSMISAQNRIYDIVTNDIL